MSYNYIFVNNERLKNRPDTDCRRRLVVARGARKH